MAAGSGAWVKSRHSRRGRRAGLGLLCCPPTPGPLTSVLAWQHPSFRPAYHWGLPAGAAPWGRTAGVLDGKGTGWSPLPALEHTDLLWDRGRCPPESKQQRPLCPMPGAQGCLPGEGHRQSGDWPPRGPWVWQGQADLSPAVSGQGSQDGLTRGRMYSSPALLALPRSALTTRALLGLAAPLGLPSHLLVFPLPLTARRPSTPHSLFLSPQPEHTSVLATPPGLSYGP